LLTGKYHKDFKERLGIFPEHLLKEIKGKDVVWVHAVSVGEIMAARNFCDRFLNKYPSKKLLISTVTKTGNDMAKKFFSKRASIIYLPLDLSWIIQKVLDKLSPQLFIMMETEIWPNLINSLSLRRIPVIIMNGRISPKSFSRYMKIKFLMKPILKKISLFCMQNTSYAQNIKAMGAPEDRIVVTGNMKFDAALKTLEHKDPNIIRKELGINPDEKVFIAGSTHPGEDEIILEVYRELLKDFKDLRLIIAPRHIERAKDIEMLAKTMKFSPTKISTIHDPRSTIHHPVLILDTMGRLSELYSIATVVFMGGSLVPKGGQNILEPAILGKAIVFGRNMFNFSDITSFFLNKKAAFTAQSKNHLLELIKKILSDRNLENQTGARAKAAVEENLGASRRNLEEVGRFVGRLKGVEP